MSNSRRGRGEGSIRRTKAGTWRATAPQTEGRGRVSRSFKKRSEAVAWIDERRRQGPSASGTLGEWIDRWIIIHQSRTKPGTYATVRPKLKAAKQLLGHVRLDRLTPSLIDAALSEIRLKSVSRAYLMARALRACLREAVRLEVIPIDPMARLQIVRHQPKKSAILSTDEVRSIINAAGKLAPMIQVMYDAGLRPGEACGLRWSDYNPTTRTLTIERSMCVVSRKPKSTKTERARRVVLSVPTASVIAPMTGQPDSPIFRTGYNRVHMPDSIRVCLAKIAKKTGIKCTPYSFRHACATHLLRAGVPITAVANRLGHANPSVTLKHYAHAMPEDQELAADAVGSILGAVN